MANLMRNPQLRLIFGITLMVVLGVSSIIPVLPDLKAYFGLTPTELGLVITVFTLPGVAIAPLSGVLADRLGRKAVLVPSLVLFGVMGAACSLAPDYDTLLAFRFVQGIGVAPLGVLAITIIGDLFNGRELATAMGFNAGVLSFGTAAYPALGGLLGLWGWRPVFALSLLALPLAWLVLRRLETPAQENSQSLGLYLKSAAEGMKRPSVLALFAMIFLVFILLYGPLVTYYPLLLRQEHGAGPLTIGLLIASASFFSAGAASQLGRLSGVVGGPWLLRAGGVLYATTFGLTLMVQDLWVYTAPLALFGLAQGLTIPTMLTLLNRLAPPQYRGSYVAVHGTLLRLGQTVAPVAMGLVYGFSGLDGVYLCAVGVSILLTAIAALVPVRNFES